MRGPFFCSFGLIEDDFKADHRGNALARLRLRSTSRVRRYRDRYRNRSIGESFDPDSPAEWGCAILRLVTDDAHAAALVARGRERARTFEWQRTARLTLDAYESLA